LLSLGIDYGTRSWKIALLQERDVVDLQEFEDGFQVLTYLDEITSRYPSLPMVLPSGFGIPLKKVQDITAQDIFEMTLKKGEPREQGLGLFLGAAKMRRVHAYCIPAVKLLPSIPAHRKVNKIDLGTSDKLCSLAFIEKVLLEKESGPSCSLFPAGKGDTDSPTKPKEPDPFQSMSFLMLEVGYAFTCLLVVKEGRIIDALGGTAGCMGPKSRGCIDGEMAYLYGFDTKAQIYSGGFLDLEERFPGQGERAFWEGLEKELLAFMHFYRVGSILLTGRNKGLIQEKLGDRYSIQILQNDREGYESAIGAAVLANGIEGGLFEPLVTHLGIKEAHDRALDWICY